jgi:hypothetical protein
MSFGPPSTTMHGAPAVKRRPLPTTNAGWLGLAQACSKWGRQLECFNFVMISDALLVALTKLDVLARENAQLRRQLANAQGWGDVPTKQRAPTPTLIGESKRTDMLGVQSGEIDGAR